MVNVRLESSNVSEARYRALHLGFVDLEGLKLLEDLAGQDTLLVNGSAFVMEQLKAWRRR